MVCNHSIHGNSTIYMHSPHFSVLLKEVLEAFATLHIQTFFDGTLGAGGHAEAILSSHSEIARYIGVDQDPTALQIAKERLSPWSSKLSLKHGNFSQLDSFLQQENVPSADAILVDLGVSSMQLDRPERGFSFMKEGPLDMRMNPQLEVTAADIVNTWSEKELGRIFRDYGEEKQWRKAAYALIKERETRPFTTTSDLTNFLTPILRKHAKKGIHPLTLIFQALRISVNRELEVLETFLSKAMEALAPGGRLAVISFHSLEDRIVKTQMRFEASDKWETSGIGGLFRDKSPSIKLLTRKPIEPTEEEIALNPRSRSAKLRIIEKLPAKSS